MDIKINKDIAQQYPDDAYKGFSVKELACILTAGALALGIVLTLYFIVGLNIHVAVYAAFPVAAPVIFVGFYKYKNMLLLDAIREWIRLQDQPAMAYEAGENHYDCYEADYIEDPEEVYGKEKGKKQKG